MAQMPFLRLFIAYGIGIFLGYYIQLYDRFYRWGCYLTIIVLGLLLTHELLKPRIGRFSLPYMMFPLLIWLGFLSIKFNNPVHQSLHFQYFKYDLLAGIISDEPVQRGSLLRFPVEITRAYSGDSSYVSVGKVMVNLHQDSMGRAYLYGDRIIFVNQTQEIPPALNPQQFDYREYMAKRFIYHQTVLQSDQLRLLKANEGKLLIGYALKMRIYLVHKFRQYLSDEPAFQLSTALLLGYRAELDPALLSAFTQTGTVHVLSVSGLHVSMVFFILYRLLNFLDRYASGRNLRLILSFICIWSYVILTGLAPPILRAGIMISFFLVTQGTRRPQNNLNTLFASAFFMMLLDAKVLFDVGFQLSYSAMLGLFTVYPLLRSIWLPQHIRLRSVMEVVWISISAQLFTAPLALFYFQQFPNFFLLGNLFIMLPSNLIMYCAIALALCPVVFLNHWLAALLTFFIHFTISGLQWLGHFPFAISNGIDFDGVQLLLSSMLLLGLLWLWQKPNKRFLLLFMILFITLITRSSWRAIDRATYRGITVYSSGWQLHLAVMDQEQVFLYSTKDSLSDAQLRYQVWPHVQRYSKLEQVVFVPLRQHIKGNRMLYALGQRWLLLEKEQDLATLPDFDVLLWRLWKKPDLRVFPQAWRNRLICFIGYYNAAERQAIAQQAELLKQRYYLLNDNFAYVWEAKNYGE